MNDLEARRKSRRKTLRNAITNPNDDISSSFNRAGEFDESIGAYMKAQAKKEKKISQVIDTGKLYSDPSETGLAEDYLTFEEGLYPSGVFLARAANAGTFQAKNIYNVSNRSSNFGLADAVRTENQYANNMYMKNQLTSTGGIQYPHYNPYSLRMRRSDGGAADDDESQQRRPVRRNRRTTRRRRRRAVRRFRPRRHR